MANCKICGSPVLAGPVMHSDCLEQMITEVTEQLCDNYCRWPVTNAEQLESHCNSCPMERLIQMAKR